MYFTDAGIEELDNRRGDEEVSLSWLAERLRDFVDLNPEFETAVDRLAKWLARLESDGDADTETGPRHRAGRDRVTGSAHHPPSGNAIHLDFAGTRYIV